MTCSNIVQTPAEYLNWAIDWSARGLGEDTIDSSTWEGSSDEFTISGEDHTDTLATMYLTGGIAGQVYTITNTIETSSGLIMQETVLFSCIAQRVLENGCC